MEGISPQEQSEEEIKSKSIKKSKEKLRNQSNTQNKHLELKKLLHNNQVKAVKLKKQARIDRIKARKVPPEYIKKQLEPFYGSDKYTCPICYQIPNDDIGLATLKTCKHKFCQVCINQIYVSKGAGLKPLRDCKFSCPMCREDFKTNQVEYDLKWAWVKKYGKIKCSQCGEILPFKEFKYDHKCPKEETANSSGKEFKPDLSKVKQNRSTFACPHCQLRHLTRQQLVEHVCSVHSDAPKAVCPICVTYPHGDPTYTTYLSGHLRIRHQFDYEEVGWASGYQEEESEEDVLRRILELSKTDH